MTALAVLAYLAPWMFGILGTECAAARRRAPVHWCEAIIVVVAVVAALQALLDCRWWFAGDALALSLNAMLVTEAWRGDPFPRARALPENANGGVVRHPRSTNAALRLR